MSPVQISCYSDVLCVWAYVAQTRVDKLCKTFGDKIEFNEHFCSIFPDAWTKIETTWNDRGGFAGFNLHLNEVAQKFPDIEINDKLWIDAKPRTSASAHQFLKAIQIIETERNGGEAAPTPCADRMSTRAIREVREAFFKHARDISDWQVHAKIATNLGIDYAAIKDKIRSSQAISKLALDYQLCQKNDINVSPTFILNEGRQKLIGNVGYRVLEANVQELLRRPQTDEASWC